MQHTRRRLLIWLAVIAAAWAAPVSAQSAGPVVAAASSLQFVLNEIAADFAEDTGDTVRFTFGSSGNLARQIRQGAPFELFLSADETFVTDLAADGFTRDPGTVYAVGRLALFIPTGSALKPDLTDLRPALSDGRVTKFAIANPEHAPYGRRAEEVLRLQELWDTVAPHLVFGENVAQAAQFTTSGNAQGGLIPHALALAPPVAKHGTAVLLPDAWHAPLRQRMALVSGAGPVAERFFTYLQQPAARVTLERHGYTVPVPAS